MRFSDILKDVKIHRTNITNFDYCISKISSSTENIGYGDVFVCRRGFKLDGHDFIKQAFERGARSFVVEKLTPELLQNDAYRFVEVQDTGLAESLMQNTYFGYPASKMKLVGITGTNGKTSVSYMLRHILDTLGHKTGLIGTVKSLVGDTDITPVGVSHFNSMTTPSPDTLFSTLAKMKSLGADTVIIETSSHALDQKRVDALSFDLGIFTNLTEDHLDYHKTVTGYKKAKRRLFDISKSALLNIDSDFGRELANTVSAEAFTYGKHPDADFSACYADFGSVSTKYTVRHKCDKAFVCCPVPGEFSLYNSLTAVAGAVIMGANLRSAAEAIASLNQIPGRLERYELVNGCTLYIDYAHTPDALKNVLSTLSAIPHKRIITVFGCGGDRERQKRPAMGYIASDISDITIITGDNSRSEKTSDIINDIVSGVKSKTNLTVIEDRKEAILNAVSVSEDGDIILLAGKGHEDYEIIGDTKRYFSERDIISKYIKSPRS